MLALCRVYALNHPAATPQAWLLAIAPDLASLAFIAVLRVIFMLIANSSLE